MHEGGQTWKKHMQKKAETMCSWRETSAGISKFRSQNRQEIPSCFSRSHIKTHLRKNVWIEWIKCNVDCSVLMAGTQCSLHNFSVCLKIFIIYVGGKNLYLCCLPWSQTPVPLFGKLPIHYHANGRKDLFGTCTHLCEVPGIHFLPLRGIQRFPKRNCVFTGSYDTWHFDTSYFPPHGTHIHRAGAWRILTRMATTVMLKGKLGSVLWKVMHNKD